MQRAPRSPLSRKQWLVALCVGASLAVPAAAWSQPAPMSLTMEGCLTAGKEPGYFVLQDEATGADVLVAGLPELPAHARSHRERVTGSFVSDEGRRVFRATALEHLSDSCTPLMQRVTEGVRDVAKGVGEVVRELQRQASLGVRGGMALDPELIIIGGHAEFPPVLDALVFRPNFEFGIGEVTALYAVNFEA